MHKKVKAFTLTEILIVVAVIGLLVSLVAPYMMRARLLANESSAQATLKAMAVALENYANDNGIYPTDPTVLVTTNPSYLLQNYFSGIYNGYTFTHTITSFTYLVTATPINANAGSRSFTISTGAVLGDGVQPVY